MFVAWDSRDITVKFEFGMGLAFIHAEFKRPVAAMRFAKQAFPAFKHYLKIKGYSKVYAMVDASNGNLLRFAEKFGFKPYSYVLGHVQMEASNG